MSRDTQFTDAAKLLIQKLFADPMPARGWREAEETQQLISAFLHDFAAHTVAFVPEREERLMRLGVLSPYQVVDLVPDMIERIRQDDGLIEKP